MFTPRITAAQLMAHYGTAERALTAGDFFTALRLADGDPEIIGISRVMLGNEVAGTATLESIVAPSPRARLVVALGHWLLGRDEEARRHLSALPDFPPAAALRAAMAVHRPRIAFFSGTEKLLGFVRAIRESGEAEIVTIGHRADLVDVPVTPATDPAALAAAVGPVDALYIDNLTILPPQLAAIAAPKICQLYDIEHYYAARGAEIGWIDWLVCIASGEHFEASLRFGLRPLVRGIGLTELWPDLSGLSGLAEAPACSRPIDVLYTGGIDMPFYPDKRVRLAALAQVDARLTVQIHGRMLEKADYYAKLGQAKFVFSSNRSPNCTQKRMIEALAHGALLLTDKDTSLELLFDCPGALAKPCCDGDVARDVEAHVLAYGDYRARLRADEGLATRLLTQMPNNARSVRGFVRYMTLLGALTRGGLGWPGLLGESEPAPAWSERPRVREPYAAKHSDMQAYQPALRRALFVPLAADKATPLAERMVALATLAIFDRPEHLLRRQPLGRQKSAVALVRVLNRARQDAPRSLVVWMQLAELLLDVGRLRPAMRVLTAIGAAWSTLHLDDRPAVVTPVFEYEDFTLVDGLIRDDLGARDPSVFPAVPDMLRRRLRIRLTWLEARAARDGGDAARLAQALDRLLADRLDDPWLLEQGILLSAASAAADTAFLRRLCLFYLRGARLCPRFLGLHFPLGLQAMALLERPSLARRMVRCFLKAKARVRLTGAGTAVTEAERQMAAAFGPAFVAAMDRLPPDMRTMLARWLANARAGTAQAAA